MKRTSLAAIVLVCPVLAPFAAEASEPSAELVEDFRFRTLLRGDGRDRLSQYRGQPLLFAWYSTVTGGLEAARVGADLEEDFAEDGFVAILMEIKNHDETYLEALALNEVPGSSCLLLKNQKLPFSFDSDTGFPPHMALIGVDGELLYAGSYSQSSKVKKMVKSEVKRVRDGWGEHPAAVEARALAYGKGELAAGLALVREAIAKDAGRPELSEIEKELSARFESRKRAIPFLMEKGEYLRALEEAKALVAAVESHEAWHAEARELLAGFEDEAARRELELDKELESLLKPLRKKAPRRGLADKVRRFAEEAGDSRVGARAERLAGAIDYAVDEL